MEQIKLGNTLTGDEKRDAIHIAIAPVTASTKLAPGQDIGFVDESDFVVGPVEKPIGIVDPFLGRMVFEGETFYMLLYPNTITSLRHDWTHPAFESSGNDFIENPSKEKSELWLREFCDTHDCPSYDVVMSALKGEDLSGGDDYFNYRIDSEYFFFGGRDAHSDIPAEFWVHVENVLGEPCRYRPESFSCSC